MNGFLLLGADALRRRRGAAGESINDVTWMQSIKVGVLQCLALIPGFSRTGGTITGGLLAGLSYEDAARFSFLLATPIIGAAALLKLPDLWSQQSAGFSIGIILAGAVSAAIFAYISVKFLLKYFETKKLWPFGVYCIVMGSIALIILR